MGPIFIDQDGHAILEDNFGYVGSLLIDLHMLQEWSPRPCLCRARRGLPRLRKTGWTANQNGSKNFDAQTHRRTHRCLPSLRHNPDPAFFRYTDNCGFLCDRIPEPICATILRFLRSVRRFYPRLKSCRLGLALTRIGTRTYAD